MPGNICIRVLAEPLPYPTRTISSHMLAIVAVLPKRIGQQHFRVVEADNVDVDLTCAQGAPRNGSGSRLGHKMIRRGGDKKVAVALARPPLSTRHSLPAHLRAASARAPLRTVVHNGHLASAADGPGSECRCPPAVTRKRTDPCPLPPRSDADVCRSPPRGIFECFIGKRSNSQGAID
jgi:hypothetical protein